LLTASAPFVTAVSTAAPRFAIDAVSASTSTIEQRGQTALTMSRSRLISSAQPGSACG
jgi:hypothetical protein